MSIWGFLGSSTQKKSLWNIASLSAPKILVSHFQGRITRHPKISSPDVKFSESFFKKSVFRKSWNYILGQSKKTQTYILYIVKQYYVFYIFAFLSLNHKIWYIILINMHFVKKSQKKKEFLFLVYPVNSNLKLRQVVMKFVFLFQCLISSINLKKNLKPFFVLKSLIFQRIFLPKVLLAAVFKNSGTCEYGSMLKAKKRA